MRRKLAHRARRIARLFALSAAYAPNVLSTIRAKIVHDDSDRTIYVRRGPASISKFVHAIAFASIAMLTMSAAVASAPVKVAFVYVDPVGDSGWTYQHDLGRRALEKALGAQVKTTY